MFKRIDLLKIVKDHLRTLRNISSNKNLIPYTDIFLFFIFPLLLAIYIVYKNVNISDHLSYLITAISILCGFLFNLLGVVYGLMDKFKADVSGNDKNGENKLKKVFLTQIHVNISFNILISIVTLIVLLLDSYIPKGSISYLSKILLTATYFFLTLFFLTLLMVLNRIYILMKKEIE